MFSQIKDRKHIEQNFHSVHSCWGHAPGVGLGGAGWVKNFSVVIWDGTPWTAHSSLFSIFNLKSDNTLTGFT